MEDHGTRGRESKVFFKESVMDARKVGLVFAAMLAIGVSAACGQEWAGGPYRAAVNGYLAPNNGAAGYAAPCQCAMSRPAKYHVPVDAL